MSEVDAEGFRERFDHAVQMHIHCLEKAADCEEQARGLRVNAEMWADRARAFRDSYDRALAI